MELERRKREPDGEATTDRKKVKAADGQEVPLGAKGSPAAPPADEEVEEFFAIVKRVHVALKYFEQRNGGGRELTASTSPKPPWRPLFKPEDFHRGEKDPEQPDRSRNAGLDLNSDPSTDVSSDSV